MAAFKILKPAADAPDGRRRAVAGEGTGRMPSDRGAPLAGFVARRKSVARGPFFALALLAGLPGCVVAGPDQDNRIDASLLTGSIAPAPGDAQAADSAAAGAGSPHGARIADARSLNPYPAASSTIRADETTPSAFAAAAQRSSLGADQPPDADAVSDSRTVRNAVSVADIADPDGRYAWSNPQSGSSGIISGLTEEREGVRICRRFTTSRQSYDGVSLYRGEACTNGEGEWALVQFVENGAASPSQSPDDT